MNNREMGEVFEQVADLLEIKGEAIYRVLAYRRASETLRTLGRDVKEISQEGTLEQIPGVGKAIASKIDELVETGKLEFYEKLVKEIPPGLVDVLRVGDVGPKKAARFWKELGITSIADLKKAAKAGKLRELSGMGEKSEARILDSIEILKRRKDDRILLGIARPIARRLIEQLLEVDGVHKAESAGSLRRWRETIGDLDIIVAAEDSAKVMETFIGFPEIGRIRGQGEIKTSVELVDGLRVQVWVHPPERFGSALQYATGSQAHNVRLRELALSQSLSLSEHGFKREDGGEILCADEEEVYETLGLPWISPELREDRGEITAAKEDRLPELVNLDRLRGELHAHSNWSDGSLSLKDMVEAARDRGMDYIAITDHSKSLGIANGLSVERLMEQKKELAKVQKSIGDKITIFHGAEVEILADGRLDYSDEVLQSLDIVVASLHTSLRQSKEKITSRLLKAIQNPHVDIIGHPTGRLIGKREPAELDMEKIIQAAGEAGVCLEINANPERLDLNDVHARMALDAGIQLGIHTDAHHPDHFDFQQYGVGVARRAWATKDRVLNTWTTNKLKKWLKARG